MAEAPNAGTLWARVLLDELARCGVRHLVISPGSRSTPLVLAAARDPRFRMVAQVDERAAGFLALGVGKGTGVPAAAITTSGTAVANLLPAVVEAAQSETPLLVLTADRPPHLRGADANQAIDQVHIFGRYPRFFRELSPYPVTPATLRHLRQVACEAVSAAVGSPAGPVHLNLPFTKPLEPVPVSGDGVESVRSVRRGAQMGSP
jgi:2-succinyl-5-enolpyruvyl-6-hydroxy-3-cyclohexene-1-carboxylate synthase